jgi:FKBP-type peptidyl-prolyl cis-trans isomerase
MNTMPTTLLLACALALPAHAEGLDPLNATPDQSTVYAMGLVHARELRSLNLSDEEFALYAEGMHDGFAREPKLRLERWLGSALTAERGRRQARIVEERRASEAFLAHAAAEPGARRLESGLVYTELEPGYGAAPGPDSVVVIHFHGTVRDGTVVESSADRDEPARVALRDAVPCWRQGLPLLQAGGRAKLVCPAALTYGDAPPSPLVTPGAVITYEVELLGVR